MERPAKRARVSSENPDNEAQLKDSPAPLASLHRSITPPPRARPRAPSAAPRPPCRDIVNDQDESENNERKPSDGMSSQDTTQVIPSPIQLTHIQDYPLSKGYNVDAVKLRDILGDPMIQECWQFNYLFDVDFVMSQFDRDVRSLVRVKIVHGSWERESANRIRVEEACSRYPNVEPIIAYMPERFGTHHSKMMILIRHDDLAQVVIHTANMIHGDWANMTQAVWRSPLLPLQAVPNTTNVSSQQTVFASGARFKRDLIAYLRAYGSKKTGSLVQQLNRFDFDSVRAALIASTPSKQVLYNINSEAATLWGWPALKDLMGRIPIRRKMAKSTKGSTIQSHIAIQISSVASLGQTNKWLKDVFFEALAPKEPIPKPKFSIIFPTPDEIRRSLEGYGSGGSIHMKTQSSPQRKQLDYMRPYLCHWAGDESVASSACIDLSGDDPPRREAGRNRAAPHIKTYIRYSDAETINTIDWAMVSSANLSTQAWGAAVNQSGEVKISSWEIGVVVWPELLVNRRDAEKNGPGSKSAVMVPCFKQDRPDVTSLSANYETVVGFRMPYDLPLTPYGPLDEPWCATASHTKPDWRGQTWIN
ncbi:Uncharacterized protein PECH_003305 [Penicillium ucsense]|uniref:PLD phosphodiesterase domain-containing protein n=1 Tax=Penicillium ucsense TaxID=2839758 RepID=A0A8J8VWV3_9EURO|nr:Uncharacterized protein PECM_002919 [Penicillium ucsense]KAF7729603.1 Uncharacterized protein PECH_003305 [Penicillium ucsense]